MSDFSLPQPGPEHQALQPFAGTFFVVVITTIGGEIDFDLRHMRPR